MLTAVATSVGGGDRPGALTDGYQAAFLGAAAVALAAALAAVTLIRRPQPAVDESRVETAPTDLAA